MAKQMYKRALAQVQKVMGKGETDSEQLERMGKYLFEDKWMGVFARDTINPRGEEGYYIVNLDTSRQPGSHWTALAVRGPVIYYFDSFARRQSSTLKMTDPNHIIVSESNPDTLQKENEENCGQRSLAWLMLFDTSPEMALSI